MEPVRFKNTIDKTLLCLIRGIAGRKTTVELRNENKVYGTIESVDHCMNIDMTDVIHVDIFGKKMSYERFFVKGKNIRYVQIPKDVSIINIIENKIDDLNKNLNFEENRKVQKKIEDKNKFKIKLDEKVDSMRKQLGL